MDGQINFLEDCTPHQKKQFEDRVDEWKHEWLFFFHFKHKNLFLYEYFIDIVDVHASSSQAVEWCIYCMQVAFIKSLILIDTQWSFYQVQQLVNVNSLILQISNSEARTDYINHTDKVKRITAWLRILMAKMYVDFKHDSIDSAKIHEWQFCC